jgi:purine nucleosidase
VPITFEFADRLRADNTTAATGTVVTILSDSDVQEFMREGLMYWWDPLNAAAAITRRLVTYQRTRLAVVGVYGGSLFRVR